MSCTRRFIVSGKERSFLLLLSVAPCFVCVSCVCVCVCHVTYAVPYYAVLWSAVLWSAVVCLPRGSLLLARARAAWFSGRAARGWLAGWLAGCSGSCAAPGFGIIGPPFFFFLGVP